MRIIGDRSRTRLLDRLIKDKKNCWASLVVVGVKDDLEAKSLLQWCRNLALTVVWRVAPGAGRQEKQRQEFARDRMRKWAAIYKRFTLVEAATADAPEMLDGQQFDAVALWGLTPAQLAAEGPAWAGLVRDGGSLVGLDHRVVDCRRVLNAAVPEWSALRDGVWSVKVRRQAAEAGVEEVGGRRAVDIAHAPDVLARDVDEVSVLFAIEGSGDDGGLGAPSVAHDPVDSRSDADDAVQGGAPVGGAEGELSRRAAIEHVEDKGISLGEGELGDPLVGVTDIGIGSRDLAQRSAVNSNGEQPVRASASPEPAAPPAVGGSELHAGTIAQPAPKRRGRPPGSKNRAAGVAAARGRKAAAP